MKQGRAVAVATLVAGALDGVAACVHAWLAGGATPGQVWRFVASGPFPQAIRGGDGWVAVGIGVHLALMAVFAATFMALVRRVPAVRARPLVWGPLYGFGLWVVMYWIVRPLRWGTWPRLGPATTGPELVFHMGLVGLTFGLVARRWMAQRT